jgi:hypothetical protein
MIAGRVDVEDLILNGQRINGWETRLFVGIKKFILRDHLDVLACLRMVVQPRGGLPFEGSILVEDRVDEQLDSVPPRAGVFLETSDGIPKLVPVPISVCAMVGDPHTLGIIQRRVELIHVLRLAESLVGAVDPSLG